MISNVQRKSNPEQTEGNKLFITIVFDNFFFYY